MLFKKYTESVPKKRIQKKRLVQLVKWMMALLCTLQLIVHGSPFSGKFFMFDRCSRFTASTYPKQNGGPKLFFILLYCNRRIQFGTPFKLNTDTVDKCIECNERQTLYSSNWLKTLFRRLYAIQVCIYNGNILLICLDLISIG